MVRKMLGCLKCKNADCIFIHWRLLSIIMLYSEAIESSKFADCTYNVGPGPYTTNPTECRVRSNEHRVPSSTRRVSVDGHWTLGGICGVGNGDVWTWSYINNFGQVCSICAGLIIEPYLNLCAWLICQLGMIWKSTGGIKKIPIIISYRERYTMKIQVDDIFINVPWVLIFTCPSSICQKVLQLLYIPAECWIGSTLMWQTSATITTD